MERSFSTSALCHEILHTIALQRDILRLDETCYECIMPNVVDGALVGATDRGSGHLSRVILQPSRRCIMPADPDVKKAQQSLLCRCYLPLPTDVDGIFGNRTRTAVFHYQLDRSHAGQPQGFSIPLAADHILGPMTKARLNPPQIKKGDNGRWVTLCQEILTFLALHGPHPTWDSPGHRRPVWPEN